MKKTMHCLMKISLILLLFCCPLGLYAQSRSISGKVVDATGEPVIGSTVTIKGTSSGTVSDLDGNFKLDVPGNNAILVITSIGFKAQEVKAGQNTHLNIIMQEDVAMLDELVVVGYGSQRRLSVTGSVGTVQAKDLARTTATTAGQALIGKVPGITFRQSNGQPGESTRFEIRNMGNPLFIIDGVEKDNGQFNNLDVNDIESISILKDGSAAIYGVRAANGVVLVKTKRGELNKKATVSVNAYYGVQNWTTFPQFSDAYDYALGHAAATINTTGINSDGVTWDEMDLWRQGYYNPATGEDYRSFDWYKFAINENAPQKYLNVSSTGGSDRTNYYMSISRLVQESTFPDFEFNRSNFQLNLDTKINQYLKVGASMNGRIESRLSPAIGDSYADDFWEMRWGINQNKPTERPYANDNPNYLNQIYNNLTNQAYGRRDKVGTRDDVWRVFQGNWDMEWTTPVKGLKATFLYSYYLANQQEEANRKQVFFYNYNAETDTYVNTGDSNGSAGLRKRQHTVWENMYRFSLAYENQFGDHGLNAILIGEASERFDRNILLLNDLIPNNFQSLFNRDDENNKIQDDLWSEYPSAGFIGRINYNYADKYLLELSGRYDGSFKFQESKRWGFFPSVSAGWRISEENFFKNNSIGEWMSNLKLRASYGEMGDDANGRAGDVLYVNDGVRIGNYDYLTGYDITSGGTIISEDPFSTNSGSPVAIINNRQDSRRYLPVTNVTWITAAITNVGLDMGFLNNRLSVEIDGFYRKRSNLLDLKPGLELPTETGLAFPPENLNTDMHMGMDGFIKWNDKIGDVQYFIGANATFARKRDGDVYGQRFANSWDEYRSNRHNRWAYVNWGYEVTGRFENQEQIDEWPVIMEKTNGSDHNVRILPGDFIFKDQNSDGIINDYDRRPIGYAEGGLPYLTYGLSLGFAWKGFDVAADFAGASLQSFQQDWETKWPFQASGNTFQFMNDAWSHADPLDPSSPWVPGERPAMRLTPTDSWHVYSSNSTYWLTNVRYLRLRNLEVGYTIPSKITEKIYMQQCRFYFTGTNLFCLDNLKHIGLDPENTDTNGLGYPQNRVLTLGINVTF